MSDSRKQEKSIHTRIFTDFHIGDDIGLCYERQGQGGKSDLLAASPWHYFL